MTASVREAAELLTAIAGSDPADPATAEADEHKRDYAAGLDADSLKGKRIGVMRFASGFGTDAGVRGGARDPAPAGRDPGRHQEVRRQARSARTRTSSCSTELKADMAKYLKSSPAPIARRARSPT